ncbi:MAG: choice-of-anchor Q domain-containing protein [bacterium]
MRTRTTPKRSAARRRVLGLLLAGALAGVVALPAAAATFTVTKTADTADGSCDADCSLREAVIAANASPGPDSIVVPAGTYALSVQGGDEALAATGDLDLTDDVTIEGAGSANTIIDAANSPPATDRVFEILGSSVSVELTGLSIRNGYTYLLAANEDGGCIRSEGSLELSDVAISGCATPGSGGAIASFGSHLELHGSTIDGNRSMAVGSGIVASGTVLIENSAVTQNTTNDAGGTLDFSGDALHLSQVTFAENRDNGLGDGDFGAVLLRAGDVTIEDSTFRSNDRALHVLGGSVALSRSALADNRAFLTAAGIVNEGGDVNVSNSTFTRNVTSGYTAPPPVGTPHVIDNHSGHVSLTNVTFYDNGSPGYSGLPGYPPSRVAVLNHDDTAVATMHMANVLLMGECGTTGHVTSDGGNIESGGHTCGFSALGDQADVPAAALPLAPFATYRGTTASLPLLAGNLAIDAGVAAPCPTTDQNGTPRPQGAACDVGAYERLTCPPENPSCAPPSVTIEPATNLLPGGATLNATVNPNGSTTGARFELGTTTSYDTLIDYASPLSGNGVLPIAVAATGLVCQTTYHHRVLAWNDGDLVTSSDLAFTTATCPPPEVTTGGASNVTSSSARLSATVSPHSAVTHVSFEYGKTPSYGATSSSFTERGETPQSGQITISHLECSTLYHYRAVATSPGGTAYGDDATFTTTSDCSTPTATTLPATNVTATSARLNGTITPNGTTTQYFFEYGPTTSYGTATNPRNLAGAGPNYSVNSSLSGLTCQSTYHFRVAALTATETIYGEDQSFTTTSACPPPTVSAVTFSNTTSSGTTMSTSVNPNGLETTVSIEYGPTTSYGNVVSLGTVTGGASLPLSAAVSDLTCATTYHARAVATSTAGTTTTADRTVTPPCPVSITTAAAFAVTDTAATLAATFDPSSFSTFVHFDYGTSTAYGQVTPNRGPYVGTGTRGLNEVVTGLSCGTTYHFRGVLTSTQGPVLAQGDDLAFTTSACPPPPPPAATTLAPSAITGSGATLNATINPNGATTGVGFEYGLTTDYGGALFVGNYTGSTDTAVAQPITGLSCGATYHVRVVAQSVGGTTYGADLSFATSACPPPPPSVTTGNASAITTTGATLNASVNPNGSSTTVTFEYGTTTSYGSSKPAGAFTGSSAQPASAALTGLACATTYHFRAVAASAGGTTNGTDHTFTTAACSGGCQPTTATASNTGASGRGNVDLGLYLGPALVFVRTWRRKVAARNRS